jgi:hypothetical protein
MKDVYARWDAGGRLVYLKEDGDVKVDLSKGIGADKAEHITNEVPMSEPRHLRKPKK